MNKNLPVFESVTVFVLTYNETALLSKTIAGIKKCNCFCDICKIVIVAKNDRCDGYKEALKLVKEDLSGKVEVHLQKSPTLEQCFFELPSMVTSSHFVIMAADMEMDPGNISDFIRIAKNKPEAIVCAAKWLKGSVVEGYGNFHALGSRTMNAFASVLFNKNVKDPFSVYQLYPLAVYKRLQFDNPSTVIYEYTIKALRNGVEYIEIPTVYRKRCEGKSLANKGKLLKSALAFCHIALRVRFSRRLFDGNNR